MERKEGSSAIILQVKKFSIPDNLILPTQQDMTIEAQETGTLKQSYSTIKKIRTAGAVEYYSVEQYTPTIDESIRFLLLGLQNYSFGYQRLAKFEFRYRKSDSKLFIFTNGNQTDLFLSRLKELEKKNKVNLVKNEFDFTKIRKLPEIKNIWGVWEKVNLAHKTVNASFGPDVDKNPEVNLAKATAINIKFDYNGHIYTITLSHDGRISTKNRIAHDELIAIFDKYFSSMIKSTP